ncbi:NUDIX hydrolase [Variovorax dokdonensis]|uniref:Phosphatase NudJ n=1 Tax=Variovorax dokdonensis TaxID=344883 RepID=A0ABT7NA23_9BURK|nr:NUDIX hydrolase [Variovorax dokdonensis]MDM0044801.1 NUDIX hydrolase [Variovorax dokdonensis]
MNRWKPNVTVAAVIEKDGRFLLVEERTARGLMLNNPAGHLERSESPAQACVREVLEETAHEFRPTHVVGLYMSRAGARGTEDVTYLRVAFCGELARFDPDRSLDDGIVRTVWMSAEEIRGCTDRHRSPLLMRCIDDYLAGMRYPLSLIHVDNSVSGRG